MLIDIFGKKIPTRDTCCLYEKETGPKYFEDPFVYLFIQTSDVCQANCPFCIYHTDIPKNFDVDKLGVILRELSNNDTFRVRKLNFTGGEPLLDLKLFDKLCNCVVNNFKFDDHYCGITLNTNGIHLKEFLPYNHLFDFIALSRHHHLDKENQEIFRTDKVPTFDEITNFYNDLDRKFIFILRCNVITGYIDTYEKVKAYMDAFLEKDITVFSFVTLMPNNEFCKTHQVDFNKLVNLSPELFKTQQLTRIEDGKEYCRCRNYAYTSESGKIGTFYCRNFCNNYIKESTLVYDGKYLRYGFGGEIIF